MDHVLAKITSKEKKKIFKVLSCEHIFDEVCVNLKSCITYDNTHNLDEDSWFKIDEFSKKSYCIDFLKNDFDAKDYDDLNKMQFDKIKFIFSVHDNEFYFQKISPSLLIKKKIIAFGDVTKLERGVNQLTINPRPDAVYFKDSDVLVFRNLATISSIFEGIGDLYKEATKSEVANFLTEPFIELAGEYNADKVSKPNRKRISLAMETLAAMSDNDKKEIHSYIENYCKQQLEFNALNGKYKISTDDELKLLLYGIEERFYTTPFGNEKRVANSVVPLPRATVT